MLLSDSKIRDLIENGVLTNANMDNVGPVSYDLTTYAFYPAEGECNEVELMPGDSVFVGAKEAISLTSDLAARVILRNSRIRQGLRLDAPLYFPGHATRLFFRVTNVSSDVISLDCARGIAQVVFERVEGEVESPYSGAFTDEFDYRGMGNYEGAYRSGMRQLEERENKILGVERRIYQTVSHSLALP